MNGGFTESCGVNTMDETKFIEEKKLQQLVQTIDPGSKLLRTWRVSGGVSAQVTAIELERSGGQMKKMIVRQYGETDLKRNPRIAADEFKLLQILKSKRLLVPAPYHFDSSGAIFPNPFIVIEFIEGKQKDIPRNVNTAIHELATSLSNIHKIKGSNPELSFLPKQEEIYAEKLEKRPAIIDESLNEGRIREMLESVWPFPKVNKTVLLHGDYWPGNILWKDGQLIAILDWEDAALGDPLADFANSRLEILWAYGMAAMNDFTNQYKSMCAAIEFKYLPYWDLFAALRPASRISEWGLDERTEKMMRERHQWFVSRAFEKIK